MSLPKSDYPAKGELDESFNRAAAADPFTLVPPFWPARVGARLWEFPRYIAGMSRPALCVNLRMTPITVTNSPFEIPAKRKSFTLLTSGTTSSTAL